jgi:hypothetical protein
MKVRNMLRTVKRPFAVLVLGVLVAFTGHRAAAGVVTITDCLNDPHLDIFSSTTRIDVGADDLVIQCALVPIGNTEHLTLLANRITVQGPSGTVAAPGKSPSIRMKARADIVLTDTTLESTNGRGGFNLQAVTGITATNSVLSISDPPDFGRQMSLSCTGALCPIDLSGSSLRGHRIKITADGTVSGTGFNVQNGSGRPHFDVRSLHGDVVFGSGATSGGPSNGGPKCTGPGGGGGGVNGTNEGRARLFVCHDVDLTGFTIKTGRFIIIQGGLCGTGTVNLTDATLNNDFGKPGEIVVTAAGGAGQINITGATLIDDDAPVNVPDVSSLNGREATPHNGFNNVIGVPNMDN